jgi:hypothetical protein
VPEHLDAFARVEAGMTDSPITDAVDFVPTTPVAADIRGAAERTARLGVREYVICARADGTGEFAGMTRVHVFGGGRAEAGRHHCSRHPPRAPTRAADEGGDGPLAGRCGAGPGPDRDLNDATNAPMIRVNVALGCTAAEVWPTWTAGVR